MNEYPLPPPQGLPPKPAFTITIDVMADGRLSVSGFPNEYNKAISVMQLAVRTVMDFFMAAAVKGEFKEQRIFMPSQQQVRNIVKN